MEITFEREGFGITNSECHECELENVCQYVEMLGKLRSPDMKNRFKITFHCEYYRKD
jgi:hypothetical protein